MSVHLSRESERGCGYRKLGGLYLVGPPGSAECGRLPYPLHACPTCGGGIRQSRAWTWILPQTLFPPKENPCRRMVDLVRTGQMLRASGACKGCPLAPENLPERAGLLWVGAAHYTPERFLAEAEEQGISKRIPAVPKGFVPGETWVFLAHPHAVTTPGALLVPEQTPGVFTVWRPERLELIVERNGVPSDKAARRAEQLAEKYGEGFRAVAIETLGEQLEVVPLQT